MKGRPDSTSTAMVEFSAGAPFVYRNACAVMVAAIVVLLPVLPVQPILGTSNDGESVAVTAARAPATVDPRPEPLTESELPDSIPLDLSSRTFDRIPFAGGETLTYSIDYGIINAGEATLQISPPEPYRGRPCYRVISVAKTNRFFSVFYKVRDTVISHIDAAGIFSWHFEKHIREGSYRSDEVIEFDHYRRVAGYPDGQYYEISPMVQDILSSLYYIRTQELEVGKTIAVDNHTGRKNYPLEVKILEKALVRSPLGEFETYVAEPVLREPGIFKHKGRLFVYFTSDDRRLPVLLKSKVLIGHFTATLIRFD